MRCSVEISAEFMGYAFIRHTPWADGDNGKAEFIGDAGKRFGREPMYI